MDKISILYAEDDIFLRKQYIKFINANFNNIDIYEAENGEEALNIYNQIKPHIIISDINMPNFTGLEVSKTIREENKEVKIILLSAFSDTNILLEAIPLNISKYLIKPIRLKELKDIIGQVIEEIKLTLNNHIFIINEYLKFDINLKKLYDCNKEIKLTKNERKLICFFIKNPNMIINIDLIFDYIWDNFEYTMTKLRSLVNRLNKKLSKKIIYAKYGQGYILNTK